MEFFYPNRTNQMWEIFGLVFLGDSQRLVDAPNKTFRLEEIKALLEKKGVAIYDTASSVRRLSGNASDKDLQIVDKTDIAALLAQIPRCHDIVCTGNALIDIALNDLEEGRVAPFCKSCPGFIKISGECEYPALHTIFLVPKHNGVNQTTPNHSSSP